MKQRIFLVMIFMICIFNACRKDESSTAKDYNALTRFAWVEEEDLLNTNKITTLNFELNGSYTMITNTTTVVRIVGSETDSSVNYESQAVAGTYLINKVKDSLFFKHYETNRLAAWDPNVIDPVTAIDRYYIEKVNSDSLILSMLYSGKKTFKSKNK